MKTLRFRCAYTEEKISIEISRQATAKAKAAFCYISSFADLFMSENKVCGEKLTKLPSVWFQAAGDNKL